MHAAFLEGARLAQLRMLRQCVGGGALAAIDGAPVQDDQPVGFGGSNLRQRPGAALGGCLGLGRTGFRAGATGASGSLAGSTDCVPVSSYA